MVDVTYSQKLDADGAVCVDQVRRSDGVFVLTGVTGHGDDTVAIPEFADPDGLAYQAWLAAGNTPGEAILQRQTVFAPRDFIALFTDAERQKLFTARQSNWQIDQFITLAMAGPVDLTNADVSADLGACVAADLLTADRAKAILAGQAPT